MWGGGMKREREMSPSMANCLMILAHGGGELMRSYVQPDVSHEQGGRVFECKTCNRQFPSFQALGGHRASHKKPRHTGDPNIQPSLALVISSQSPAAAKRKPKTHECSVCGLEFAIGQALGGHMRRHRGVTLAAESETSLTPSFSPPPATPQIFVPHVLMRSKSNSSRRICLDLNLSPKENGMDYHQIINIRDQKVSPILHCYL